MTKAQTLLSQMRLPVIAAPLFIISNPDLVIAQCKAGIIGSFPSLNARPLDMLDEWLVRIKAELAAHDVAHPDKPAAPFAVNLIVHKSNTRLEEDLELCVKHEVPVIICSLGAREDVYEAIHSYGGIVLHDIINQTFAHKAIEKGADGLIAVATGAGGHAGVQSPFALIQEIREWFDGPLLLSGAISTGESLLAAQVLGADLGYAGSPFIATDEANAVPGYKQMIADSGAEDIVTSSLFTGVSGNYLAPSIRAAGMDPDALASADASSMSFSDKRSKPKAWSDVWGAGQGIGAVRDVRPAASVIARLEREYNEARARMAPIMGEAK